MSSPAPRAHHRIHSTIFSLACHAAVVALLVLGAMRATLKKPERAEVCCVAALQIAGGSRAPRSPLPHAPAANLPAKNAPVQEPGTRAGSLPRDRRPARASGTHAAAARPSDSGTNAVAGNGSDAQNTTPAFPVFSPNPAVHDRALLPVAERQVVVDVRLDAGGDVISENLVRSIGNVLDQTVLDIVKTWRFQPATVDGKPVPSEAEVIVSFSQRYPVSNS